MLQQQDEMVRVKRSARSEAFEAYWASLPRRNAEALVPRRSDLDMRRLKPFLGHIFIGELDREREENIVRLFGSALAERCGTDLTGIDYVGAMAEQHRAATWKSCVVTVEKPCGCWQITSIDTPRELAVIFEMTYFPLVGDKGEELLLGLGDFLDIEMPRTTGVEKAAINVAYDWAWIDVGAGTPA